MPTPPPSMAGRTCLVTGANTGIGLETARALARAGATVILAYRDPTRGEPAVADVRASTGNDHVEGLVLDLASFASIRRAAAEVLDRHAALHVLVNNAGLMLSDRGVTREGIELTFGINHVGPVLFTSLLLDRMKASAPARIVNVASDAHRRSRGLPWDDLQRERAYDGFGVYSDSKLCNILYSRELARRLAGSGVTVNALHPGVVRSGFASAEDTRGLMRWGWALIRPFLLSAEEGAQTSVYLATSPEVEGVTGRYFAKSKEKHPTAYGQDDAAAARLWAVTEDLITRLS